ncbi:MAG: AAA family ATPase, partial [Candidatus Heimdallarchaeota archaeon]|nr:AAA family ATPase [Candidatus Heimdallarchaeota archaeon]
MQVEITIKNYRCFPDTNPAKILLQKGFTSFVGVNNSGKSTLLKFFYEFRNLFQNLSSPELIPPTLDGKFRGFNFPSSISDVEEIFCNANNRDLEIQIRYIYTTSENDQNNELTPDRFDIIIKRGTSDWISKIYLADGELIFRHDVPHHNMGLDETTLHFEGNPKAELSGIIQTFKTLSETIYIGPFRNAINAVPGENYYDIQVGKHFIDTWQRWKTGVQKKQNEDIIRLTDDIKHIFDYDALEINSTDAS